MIRRLLLPGWLGMFVFLGMAPAEAASTMTIAVIGQSTVANTAPYGTVVDRLFGVSAGKEVSGVTWSVDNANFYIDAFGGLHSAWQSMIAPGPQAMTITAAAPGYTNAALPLTVTVTGTLALQTMVVTTSQVATAYDNSPHGTIIYALTVSQTNGTLGNLASGVNWTVDNPLFAVVNTMANSGIYYLTTDWTGTIAAGPQTVNLTASAPGYNTANVSLTIGVVAAAAPTMTINVNGASSVPDNVVAGTVVDMLSATNSSGTTVSGVTYSVSNSNFTVTAGNLVTTWLSPISPGSQSLTITANAPGFQTATLPLTVTIGPPCQ